MQVQLAPSAVAADGSGAAAATGVPGGNRARVRDGVALFKDVRIVAERPGTFTLAAKTASRKARAPTHCGPGLECRVGTAPPQIPCWEMSSEVMRQADKMLLQRSLDGAAPPWARPFPAPACVRQAARRAPDTRGRRRKATCFC